MSAEAMFAAVIFLAMSKVAAELVWTTETLFTASCEGQDKGLIWNFSKGENDIVKQLHWYYNKTTLICYHSESRGFHVTPLYQGRVERLENTGILLKNLSLDDAGEYTLYPKLVEEETENVQTISLTVYETPTQDCTPKNITHSGYVLICSNICCGRQQLSIERRGLETQDTLGNDDYLIINSSWKAEDLLCCPQGPRMNSYKGKKTKLCVVISDFSTDEDSSSITHPTVTGQASKDTEDKVHVYLVLVILICAIFLSIFISCIVLLYRRSIRRLETTLSRNANMDEKSSMELHAHQTVLESTGVSASVLNPIPRTYENGTYSSLARSSALRDDTDMSNGTSDYEDAVSELSSISSNTGD